MGRSAALVATAEPIERFNSSGRTVFSSGPFDLEVEKSGDRVRHRVRLRGEAPVAVPEVAIPVEVAIGSGTRGRSYLSVEEGAVWQSPISWYGPDQRWDVSPGFHLGAMIRRPILGPCLYCHVNRVEPIPGAENRYREPLLVGQAAIGCERCHGPGTLHVAERTRGDLPTGTDTSIVNPRHLAPALQSAICEQCHLQGEERVDRRGRNLFEFRPGLPFEQFVSVHVRHPEIAAPNKSVGQFEQIEQSRCFTGSGGRLLCTSCHDPHKKPEPATRETHYRERCLTCHNSRSKECSLPLPRRQEKNDSCIACHMPKGASSNIIHASVTDHRIPRIPTEVRGGRGLPAGAVPLVRFRAGPFSPSRDELDRDLGIALARFTKKPLPPELEGGEFRFLAIDRLKSSLARWPGDAEAWGAMAIARSGRNDANDKLKAARNAVQLAAESESALVELTEAATAAGEFDLAAQTAEKCIRANPTASHPLMMRAFVALSKSDWDQAEASARAALRIHPLHPQLHFYLGISLHRKGDPAAGLREAETAARLESDPGASSLLMDSYRRAIR